MEIGLSQDAFLKRAGTDADFSECFGMFKYFYLKVVKPMEEMVNIVVLNCIILTIEVAWKYG
jgi:hypothetical protein